MKGNLKIYDSFEQLEEDQIAYQLSITPEQRIKEAVELIKKVYNYQEGQPRAKTIKILKYE